LYLGARLPEHTGRFTARSIGKNPHWEEEDRIRFVIRVANENDWMLQVGPLGAYSVKWRWTGEDDWYTSSPEKCSGFMVTASMGSKEWQVEAAVPLQQLGSPRNGLHVSVERIRAARPGAPEQHWRWPDNQPMSEVAGSPQNNADVPDPVFRPRVIGNNEPPIQVGQRNSIPSLDSDWNDVAWNNVPVWVLYRNEPGSRSPVFPTEVRMVRHGRTLAVIARCAEPDRVVARVQERDGAVDHDDSFQIYLTASGSSYIKYAVNSLGYVQDAIGYSGGPRISRPHVEWNSPVRSYARQVRGEWIARLDLPLDFIANALGETSSVRDWRILLMRFRPGRSGEPPEASVLPVTQSVTPYCPARYRRLTLVEEDPSQIRGPQPASPADSLSFAPARVFSPEERKQLALSNMLDKNIHDRTLEILRMEKASWDQVHTLADWENFRDRRWKALSASMGEWPKRESLQTRVMSEFHGDGYRRQNLVYQTQPGLWVTANLYLPSDPRGRIPGIVIAHSLHAPKTQFELQDMGILWARAGCAVLIMDQIGYGERMEAHPWEREAYHSRYITGMQLYLVGESLIKWMVWDIIRGIDLLFEQKDIDQERIILLGAVAGGGDPAAIVAALDKRISAVVPFNFGESTPEIPRFIPEKNQWPLDLADPGLGDWDTTRCLRRGVVDQFLQWTICAMAAPRRFVYSYELGWKVEDLPAWSRYKKVYELYHAQDHLADAHGFGPFPGPGECWNIGPAQRRSLYSILERWFGIPAPFEQMEPSTRANLTSEPSIDRRPETELAAFTPATASELHMRTVHELAREIGRAKVEKARSSLARLTPQERLERMRDELRRRLGNIEPSRKPQGTLHWTKKLPEATVEAITVPVEAGITLPILLYLPSTTTSSRPAVVVGVAEGGKELFLAKRSQEIEKLLRSGVAVCLADVRGTGEISPDSRRDPDNDENMQAVNEEMLGETLVGRRLKDLRTVLTYLEQRQDLDSTRLALWGESLMPVNGASLSLDELSLWQVAPQIQQQGEPLGGLLAIFGALYEPQVRTVVVNGGLVSFESVLDDAFSYVSADVTIPGFLEAGDLADVEAALAPRPMLLGGLIDGRNRLISERDLRGQLQPLYDAYHEAPTNLSVRHEQDPSGIPEWLLAHM
jgi:cephalosporin-C deacetylase-like acetyl esterase